MKPEQVIKVNSRHSRFTRYRLPFPRLLPSGLTAAVALALALCVASGCAPELSTASPLFAKPLRKLPPGDRQIGAWRRTKAPSLLFRPVLDRLAGAAPPAYLRALSFEQGTQVAYHLPTAPREIVHVSVLQFAQDDHAFAALVAYRPPGASSLAIGAESYRAGDVMITWKGRYVIHVDAAAVAAPRRRAVLVIFARAFAERLPGFDRPTGTLARLPARGLRLERCVWLPGNQASRSYLGPGVQAGYTLARPKVPDDAGSTAVTKVQVFQLADAVAATEALRRLGQEYKVQKLAVTGLAVSKGAFQVSPAKGRSISAFVSDNTLVLVDGQLSGEQAAEFCGEILTRLDQKPPRRTPGRRAVQLQEKNKRKLSQKLFKNFVNDNPEFE